MASESIIADTARKHGVADEDVLRAYANPIRIYEVGEGLVMFIGPEVGADAGGRCR